MTVSKKILLIDDDKDFVASNTDLLEAYGYEVFSAFDGESGFQKAKKEKPDLIVLDVMMAYDTEGIEVARRLQIDPLLKGVKILLVSGITKELKLPQSLKPDESWLPVTSIMEKPIDPCRFINEVQQILDT